MSMLQEDRRLSDISVGDLMISSEKVAHVQVNNPLEHALLVLVKSGYSAVPVLDTSYKLVGIISKTAILNQILGMERFEIEKLSELKVKEAMNDNLLTLKKENNLLDGLNATIDHAFICVVDKDNYFDGILTRRAILKQLKKEIYVTNIFNK
ncbi:CBS domain-containing protein [Oceanobacillus caeni]|uniref:CBS domain-containing protein YkuL n=1 Tax=Oceanobacillus caeni TaxID=405946 RepID=A0ABR5MFE7_9BACI|nr:MULTISPECIES: cyclic-di-AMP-binding protein CbpB [Bacillaceae]KPH70249.1 CBS domain-containing protein YkuL [Oceanobacillus caeni]MBU8791697.1 CBS domain-containing protein [Oceanobacillus caeni]MCR1836150.1 CBS domain-containing protein [Oceanobacillus caeni]MED4476145.1 c-di-AMP-binding protein CbpB [Oceanobacillus caeni]